LSAILSPGNRAVLEKGSPTSPYQLFAHVTKVSIGSRFAKLREGGIGTLMAGLKLGGAVGAGEFVAIWELVPMVVVAEVPHAWLQVLAPSMQSWLAGIAGG